MTLKNPTITKEQAKEELLKVKNKLGKVPYKKEFFKHRTLKGCHEQAISILFGPNSWNNFLTYSELELNVSSPQKPQLVKCSNCGIEFSKLYSEIIKTENHFCSHSCSASYNNTNKIKHGKYKSKKKCKNCGVEHSRNSEFCSPKCKTEDFMKNTKIKDCLTKGELQQKYSGIRGIARNYAAKLPNKHSCQFCGYDKHIEIAHIKPLSEFNIEQFLIEANNKNNLLALCPNCHWELDNGLIKLEK